MNDLSLTIEAYLLERGDWVTSEDICGRFGIKDARQLRQVGDTPGLCSAFAISGDKGFKHVSCATRTEFERFCSRLRLHGIAEFMRVRGLRRRRANVTRQVKRPAVVFERDSGQVLFPGLTPTDVRKEVVSMV